MNNNYMNNPGTGVKPDWYYPTDDELVGKKFRHKSGVYTMIEYHGEFYLVDNNHRVFSQKNVWAQRKHEFELI